MNNRISIYLFLCAVMTGCSSLTKFDCTPADWSLVGFEDGESGKPVSDVEGYQAICTEQGAIIDLDAYQSGHEKGLRVYCQPENGFELGTTGIQIAVACPADLADAFSQEYREGSRFYPIYQQMHEVQRSISSNMASIGTFQSSIGTDTARMNSSDISHVERNQLRQNIDSMESQIRAYESTNTQLELELSNLARSLEEMKARNGR